ncbi:choice-of-anchor I family protein [Defluviicoccus vanus]|uniref:Alkaline phosphatase n=1 Tax=Defluviicoccus vanus TaxID=111831 RepID=A0A7H1MZJ8_9PROT|nr:choice-of-anchor I family protein [Defluviicoccus vanus]QNT68884.1 alkaline phosphatase [Defluviicoccus vanus]
MRPFILGATAALASVVLINSAALAKSSIRLELAGSYKTGVYGEGAAEISAYDCATKRAFVVNGDSESIDILDLSDPANPVKVGALSVLDYGSPNSVATARGLIAIAVEAEPKTEPGHVLFYTVTGTFLSAVEVGAQPDMLTFTPDGKSVLVANEGEATEGTGLPNPVGSISLIDIAKGPRHAVVTTLGFEAYNGQKTQLIAKGVRFVDPNATVAQDLEPEYIAVAPDGSRAWVSLQENNALAFVDLKTKSIDDIVGLGSKNFALAANPLDASDKDGKINIVNWPASGFYMPDGLVAFSGKGKTYLISANEGDDRDDFLPGGETARVKNLKLDPTVFPNASTLQQDENLGRLTVSKLDGDTDGDGDYDQLFAFGARSFSIWGADGTLAWDSGAALEQITAAALPADFNSDNAKNNSFDTRSDNKGPEPEGVAVGQVNGHLFAFIGLERIGGVVAYNIDNPLAPTFVQYINNRDFAGDAEKGIAGDLGPEGVEFVPAGHSPTGTPLLIVANEVSGSTSIYYVKRVP